jgi:hypothetical protein
LPAPGHGAPFATPVAPPPPPERKSGKALLRILVSSLIAAVLVSYGCFLQGQFQGEQAIHRLIGFSGSVLGVMVFSLLVAAIGAGILAIFKKPFRRVLVAAYCLVVLSIAGFYFMGSALISVSQKKTAQRQAEAESAKRAIEGIESDAHAMLESLQGDQEGSPFPADAGPVPDDDMGKVRHMAKIFFHDMAATQREYSEALNKGGLTTLFQADRLAADENMEESHAILARSRKVVEEYRKKTWALQESAPDRIKKYRMAPGTRQEVLEGMKDERVHSAALHDQIWDLEEKILNHMAEAIDHLEKTRADWSIANNLITFTKDEDHETFQAVMAEIEACSTQQTKLREGAMQRMKVKMDSAKSALPK